MSTTEERLSGDAEGAPTVPSRQRRRVEAADAALARFVDLPADLRERAYTALKARAPGAINEEAAVADVLAALDRFWPDREPTAPLGTVSVTLSLLGETAKAAVHVGRVSLLPDEADEAVARSRVAAVIEAAYQPLLTVLAERIGLLDPAAHQRTAKTVLRSLSQARPGKAAQVAFTTLSQAAWELVKGEAVALFPPTTSVNYRGGRLIAHLKSRVVVQSGDQTIWSGTLGADRDIPADLAGSRAEVLQRISEHATTAAAAWAAQSADFEARADALVAPIAGAPDFPTAKLKDWIRKRLSTAAERGEDLEVLGDELQARVRPDRQREERVAAVMQAIEPTGLAAYKAMFPLARSLGRKLTLYAGPTNSGKTYHALNTLAAAETGMYLAPLRLLALEGQEQLAARGRTASLVTGEERDIRDGACFVASTIEMANYARPVDVAVVDEAQLLTDPDRGWAWTQAIVGAPARHVVMTGSLDAIPLLQTIADYLGEPLEVVRTERLTPLVVGHRTQLQEIQPGTAVIAFSRRDVLGLKEELEKRFRVAVVYGALSPEVRREQARTFREGEAEVLVSTDAIGLGLNFGPIKQIAFYTLTKWDGKQERQLTNNEIRQIAGRAGRYGAQEKGIATAMSKAECRLIEKALESPAEAKKDAPIYVGPSAEHVEAIGRALGLERLADVLTAFKTTMRFDHPRLRAMVTDDMLQLAGMTDTVAPHWSLSQRLAWAASPVDTREDLAMTAYAKWLRSAAQGQPSVAERLSSQFTSESATDHDVLHTAEALVKVLTLYCWLSFREPDLFPEREAAQDGRRTLNGYIERSLRSKGLRKRCPECGRPLPALWRFRMCDGCFHAGRAARSWDDEGD